jgi:hypothetical protein
MIEYKFINIIELVRQNKPSYFILYNCSSHTFLLHTFCFFVFSKFFASHIETFNSIYLSFPYVFPSLSRKRNVCDFFPLLLMVLSDYSWNSFVKVVHQKIISTNPSAQFFYLIRYMLSPFIYLDY